jgi:hypothetical protein
VEIFVDTVEDDEMDGIEVVIGGVFDVLVFVVAGAGILDRCVFSCCLRTIG